MQGVEEMRFFILVGWSVESDLYTASKYHRFKELDFFGLNRIHSMDGITKDI
jgi:hypothetical protein